jgi:DNA polymerase III epsilon subunit-like protein
MNHRRRTDAPPPDSVWDAPISEAPFVFVDLEMTGLHPMEDRIVEICASRVVGVGTENPEVTTFSTLVFPDANLGGGAEYHGLDAEALGGAPPFSAVAGPLAELLNGAVFVAHGARVDLSFLEASYARLAAAGEIGGEIAVSYKVSHWLDTVTLARRAFAQPSYALSKLAAALGIDPGRSHRAEADVLTTRALFDRLLVALSPANARELQAIRAGVPVGDGTNSGPPDRPMREAILAQCLAAIAEKRPLQLAYRPSRRPEILLQVVPLSLHEDRLFCHDVATFGRRELRVERILRIEALNDAAAP